MSHSPAAAGQASPADSAAPAHGAPAATPALAAASAPPAAASPALSAVSAPQLANQPVQSPSRLQSTLFPAAAAPASARLVSGPPVSSSSAAAAPASATSAATMAAPQPQPAGAPRPGSQQPPPQQQPPQQPHSSQSSPSPQQQLGKRHNKQQHRQPAHQRSSNSLTVPSVSARSRSDSSNSLDSHSPSPSIHTGIGAGLGISVFKRRPFTWHALKNISLISLCWCFGLSAFFVQVSTTQAASSVYYGPKEATVPLGLLLAVTTVSAFFVPRLVQQYGPRRVYMVAAAVAAVGAVIDVIATITGEFGLLILGALLQGTIYACTNHLRFAVLVFVRSSQQARAISLVVAGGALSAALGPELAMQARNAWGDAYGGSYIVSVCLYVAYFLVLTQIDFSRSADSPAAAAALHAIEASRMQRKAEKLREQADALAVAEAAAEAEAEAEDAAEEEARDRFVVQAQEDAQRSIEEALSPSSQSLGSPAQSRRSSKAGSKLRKAEGPSLSASAVESDLSAAAASQPTSPPPPVNISAVNGVAGAATNTNTNSSTNTNTSTNTSTNTNTNSSTHPIKKPEIRMAAAHPHHLSQGRPQSISLSRLDRVSPINTPAGSPMPQRRPTMTSIVVGNTVIPAPAPPRPFKVIARQEHFILAVLAATVAYSAMGSAMAAMPLAMASDGFTFEPQTYALELHVLGMFLPSLIASELVDLFFPLPIVMLGLVIMVASELFFLLGDTRTYYHVGMISLGVGWNFVFVSSTKLLATTFRSTERSKVVGFNEVVVLGVLSILVLAASFSLHSLTWELFSILHAVYLFLGAAVIKIYMWYRICKPTHRELQVNGLVESRDDLAVKSSRLHYDQYGYDRLSFTSLAMTATSSPSGSSMAPRSISASHPHAAILAARNAAKARFLHAMGGAQSLEESGSEEADATAGPGSPSAGSGAADRGNGSHILAQAPQSSRLSTVTWPHGAGLLANRQRVGSSSPAGTGHSSPVSDQELAPHLSRSGSVHARSPLGSHPGSPSRTSPVVVMVSESLEEDGEMEERARDSGTPVLLHTVPTRPLSRQEYFETVV